MCIKTTSAARKITYVNKKDELRIYFLKENFFLPWNLTVVIGTSNHTVVLRGSSPGWRHTSHRSAKFDMIFQFILAQKGKIIIGKKTQYLFLEKNKFISGEKQEIYFFEKKNLFWEKNKFILRKNEIYF